MVTSNKRKRRQNRPLLDKPRKESSDNVRSKQINGKVDGKKLVGRVMNPAKSKQPLSNDMSGNKDTSENEHVCTDPKSVDMEIEQDDDISETSVKEKYAAAAVNNNIGFSTATNKKNDDEKKSSLLEYVTMVGDRKKSYEYSSKEVKTVATMKEVQTSSINTNIIQIDSIENKHMLNDNSPSSTPKKSLNIDQESNDKED